MNFYSTNSPLTQVPFKEAVFNSLPQDRGLYMPVSIPQLDAEFIENIDQYSLPEIAFKVAQTLLTDAIPEEELKAIIDDAINFFGSCGKAGRGCIRAGAFPRPIIGF